MSFFKTLGLIFLIIFNFISPKSTLVDQNDGRVNVLVMGFGGVGHEGGDLTDTMILTSVSLSEPRASLISIPRDLWIPEIRAKVNSAYHYGGVDLAKLSVERVVGIPIHYTILIDFSAFKNVIDALEGIDVNVENGFTDTKYPIAGKENDPCLLCRYETLRFAQGKQLMDGETALKFVRSRHANGDEGTDSARESRQQKVIDAIKNKILSPGVFLNPWKAASIFKVVRDSVKIDMNEKDMAIIARKFFDSRNSINKYLIPENLLIHPPITKTYDLQYVFTPKAGNGRWEGVNAWVLSILK